MNVYETPIVTKVEYDTSDRITASACGNNHTYFIGSTQQIVNLDFVGDPECLN